MTDDRALLHRRTITFDVSDAGAEVTVVGTLTDERPWATEPFGPPVLHRMELVVSVRLADLRIVDAQATMHDFPHSECPAIAPAFRGLIGLSVARGYTRQVQERFGGIRGCSHLEHLARLIGPTVVQAAASLRARQVAEGADPDVGVAGGGQWLRNTCHVWADGGVGQQKLALGWRPGSTPVPVPPLAELQAEAPGG
jgi:hypothetical protein